MRRLSLLQKSDRHVIYVLLGMAAAALVVISLTRGRDDTATALQGASRPGSGHDSTSHRRPGYHYYQGTARQPRLVPFDPNTADSTLLLQLGLQPWQVRNIYRYRAAGGVYRQKRDFARLYGLTLKQYRQLEPYIRISADNLPADRQLYAYTPLAERDTLRYPVKLLPEERIVLNHADTAALRRVPGIGSYFAAKIVEYRQRLGGYFRVQQLLEIEDFPETAVTFFIIPDSTLPRHWLEVNRLSLNQLKRHPYINYYQARAIVDYRRTHGPLKSLQELKLLRDFPPEAIERLEPYVAY